MNHEFFPWLYSDFQSRDSRPRDDKIPGLEPRVLRVVTLSLRTGIALRCGDVPVFS
jgi:hypothetical protein